MKRLGFAIAFLAASIASADAPSTTNNDDSCDIAALPAATLLLPYFEVDVDSATGESTLFTITNVTQRSQIARATIWTDRGYPVFSFDVFLTGYDVQPISLRDVLTFGRLAPPLGTSSKTWPGSRSFKDNPLLDMTKCEQVANQIPPQILADLRSALTTGRVSSCTTPVGGEHAPGKAIGYVTVDLVRDCDAAMPVDADYFSKDLLYDNVLIGDYQQIDIGKSSAQSGTMVHIRAVPEGGAAGSVAPTFDRTFYSRLQNGATVDRRQPLPSTFAARWISGSTALFDTSYKIWHDGSPPTDGIGCASVDAGTPIVDSVRFDEDENPVMWARPKIEDPIPLPPILVPVASRVRASDQLFPPSPGRDVAGWMYLNLDATETMTDAASQNWAIVSMEAEGRFSVDFDATLLGNGCSPAAPLAANDGSGAAIGPAPNDNPAPQAAIAATTDNDDSCDITQAPAATLLLPHFDVDLRPGAADADTLFTIANVTMLPRIARVTIWTDRAYPVLTFNVFLTGYDIQSLSLRDILGGGLIAPPAGTSSETEPGPISAGNHANPLLDVTNCDRLPVAIPPSLLANLKSALTTGLVPGCEGRVGNPQSDLHARGYVTIDVVDNCGSAMPTDPAYFTSDILYDNVLAGDYQRIDREGNFAQSSAMVHIRAIPEGGTQGSATASFERTFYSRLQFGGTSDRRQPLPATFAARWIRDDLMDTSFVIWREALTRPDAGCIVQQNARMPMDDLVRFDEDENPVVSPSFCPVPCPRAEWLPVSSRVNAAYTAIFPPNPGGDVGGWMYLNLHYADVISRPVDVPAQNWVVVSMAAAGRFSGDFDAPALGNGCSPPAGVSGESGQPPAIGPAPNGGD